MRRHLNTHPRHLPRPALLLVYAAIACRLPNPRTARDAAQPSGSYRDVLADPALRSVLPLIAMLFAVGYAQHAAAFPAFATGVGGLPVSALGIVFAANAVTIVLAQLAVLRVLGHWRRSRALALAGATWALAWATALAAGGVGGGVGATIGFAAAMALFGLGETMLAPALGPIVNDLATDGLRGRYNGASALSSTTGFMLGPAIAGLALGAGLAMPLVITLGCACNGHPDRRRPQRSRRPVQVLRTFRRGRAATHPRAEHPAAAGPSRRGDHPAQISAACITRAETLPPPSRSRGAPSTCACARTATMTSPWPPTAPRSRRSWTRSETTRRPRRCCSMHCPRSSRRMAQSTMR